MIPQGESKVLTETSRITVLINNHDLCYWLIRNCKHTTEVQILRSMRIQAEIFPVWGEKFQHVLVSVFLERFGKEYRSNRKVDSVRYRVL